MKIYNKKEGGKTYQVKVEGGDKSWYLNGKLHREDGPAVEGANGYKAWYVNDTKLTEKEWKSKVKLKPKSPPTDSPKSKSPTSHTGSPNLNFKYDLKEIRKKQLKKMILEAAKDIKSFENGDLKKYDPEGLEDKLGAFFIVNKPPYLSKDTHLSDIVFKTNVFYLLNQLKGGLQPEEIVGIFKSKSEANKLGNKILKNFKSEIQEIEGEAKQYKKLKSSLTTKLKGLKNK